MRVLLTNSVREILQPIASKIVDIFASVDSFYYRSTNSAWRPGTTKNGAIPKSHTIRKTIKSYCDDKNREETATQCAR